MARSISNAKILSTFVIDQIYVVARRGYATTSTGGVSGSVRGSGVVMTKKVSEESKKSTTWVPDPVTGYYKPEGQSNKLDAADLRELLLKQKTHRN